MTTIRKTIQWMIALVLLAAASGGGYAYWFWNRSDELLRKTVLDTIRDIAPDWSVDIARARFDFQGRVHLYDVRCRHPAGTEPWLDIPEAVLTVDREQLAEGIPVIHRIRLVRPRLSLARHADGRWTWQDLPPIKPLDNSLPECHFESLTIGLNLEHADGRTPAHWTLQDGDVQLVPSGKREYLIKIAGKFDHADEFSTEGRWNLEAASWNLAGHLKRLQINDDLLANWSEFSGEMRAGLENLYAASARLSGGEDSPQSDRQTGVTRTPEQSLISATAELQFHVMQWKPDAEREFKLSLSFHDGALRPPLAPFPLHNLRGRIDCDNQQILIKQLSLYEGSTCLKIESGRIFKQGDLRPAVLDVLVTDLPLEDRFRRLMPEACGRVYDSIQPSGAVDIKAHLEFNGRDHWEPDTTVTIRNGTLTHVKFPYTVEQVQGTMVQKGELIDITLAGVAGRRPVTLRGRIKNPGAEAVAWFGIKTAGLPLDDRFRHACSPKIRAALDMLRAEGDIEGTLQLFRPAGPNQPLSSVIQVKLQNGTLNFRLFPYELTGVTGDITSEGDEWRFESCRAKHGETDVTFSGTYLTDDEGRGQVDLKFNATGAVFDNSLQSALPKGWQAVWQEVNPKGRFDAAGRVGWTAGFEPSVKIDAILQDAAFCIRSFPFALDDVRGELKLDDGKLIIKSLAGRHDETRLRTTGDGEVFPDGEWRVRLEKLIVDDLVLDRAFRKTLPQRLRSLVDTLDPRGKVSIKGMIEFRGKAGDEYPVTAAWDTVSVYTGATLTAGVDLKDLHGKTRFRGTWDGDSVVGDGSMDLASVSILGYQLTEVRGPVSMAGTRLIVGSKGVVDGSDGGNTDRTQRVTAKFIDGLASLDAVVELTDNPRYRVRMTLSNGELRRYAQKYMSGTNKLAGVINGWIDLYGEGTDSKRLGGKGQLVISPAALYELPVIVAIFKVLSFAPVDTTAFDQARFEFEVGGGLFQFKRIDLVGNAINLVGRGTVRFDGKVALDFISTMGRNQLAIPLISPLINEMTKGLVGVQVRGTTKDPKAVVLAAPQIPEALRNLMGVFNPRAPQRK